MIYVFIPSNGSNALASGGALSQPTAFQAYVPGAGTVRTPNKIPVGMFGTGA